SRGSTAAKGDAAELYPAGPRVDPRAHPGPRFSRAAPGDRASARSRSARRMADRPPVAGLARRGDSLLLTVSSAAASAGGWADLIWRDLRWKGRGGQAVLRPRPLRGGARIFEPIGVGSGSVEPDDARLARYDRGRHRPHDRP